MNSNASIPPVSTGNSAPPPQASSTPPPWASPKYAVPTANQQQSALSQNFNALAAAASNFHPAISNQQPVTAQQQPSVNQTNAESQTAEAGSRADQSNQKQKTSDSEKKKHSDNEESSSEEETLQSLAAQAGQALIGALMRSNSHLGDSSRGKHKIPVLEEGNPLGMAGPQNFREVIVPPSPPPAMATTLPPSTTELEATRKANFQQVLEQLVKTVTSLSIDPSGNKADMDVLEKLLPATHISVSRTGDTLEVALASSSLRSLAVLEAGVPFLRGELAKLAPNVTVSLQNSHFAGNFNEEQEQQSSEDS